MLIISSHIPTNNLPIYRVLSRLIQSFFYSCLPAKEHEGYRHSSGKVFKAMNFTFTLHEGTLEIRYRSLNPAYEQLIAMKVLKDGLQLGDVHLVDTTVSIEEHTVETDEVQLSGYVGCAVQDLFGKKLWLESRDSRHLDMMKTNILQRYETFFEKTYEDTLHVELKWQSDKYKNFWYGNNTPFVAWKSTWLMKAKPELINMMLSSGVGAKTMNAGMGMLSV